MYLVDQAKLGFGEGHALLEREQDVVIPKAFPLPAEVVQHLAPHGLECCPTMAPLRICSQV